MARKKAKKHSSSTERSLTLQQWASMKKYNSFVVPDPEEGQPDHIFHRGDYATILPARHSPGSPIKPHHYWVGIIKAIRAFVDTESDSNDVWALVQWLYSGQDARGAIKSFPSEHCGEFERLHADSEDFVTAEAFNELIKVHSLRDSDPEAPHITRDEFYSRYTIKPRQSRIMPKVGEDSCICNQPYYPDNDEEDGLMHFCPRPSCRRWYHYPCLEAQGTVETCSAQVWDLRLMATDPDDDSKMSLFQRIPGSPSKRTRRSLGGGAARCKEKSDPTLATALNALPSELITTAQQPIVRGRLYWSGGVSGNVNAVVQARRLVYSCLNHWDLPEDWESTILGEGLSKTTFEAVQVRVQGSPALPRPFLCPKCKSAI